MHKTIDMPHKPEVLIELSSVCNCKCMSCPHSIYKKNIDGAPFNRPLGFMDFGLYKQIIDHVWTVTNRINFSFFGEPMLHPRFLDCIKYLQNCKPQNAKIVLISNMTCITSEIMDMLVALPVSKLKVSLDSASSDTFEKIRAGTHCLDMDGKKWNGNRFEMICSKIEHWFRLPKRPSTRHEFVVSSRNVHEVDSFVKRWMPLLRDIDDIYLKSILSYGGTMLTDSFLNKHPCRIWEKEHQMVIDWQGNVSPCNLDTNMDMIIGKFPEQKLTDIWNGEKYKQIREGSIKRTIVPCNTCIDGNNRGRDLRLVKGSKWDKSYLKMYKQNFVQISLDNIKQIASKL